MRRFFRELGKTILAAAFAGLIGIAVGAGAGLLLGAPAQAQGFSLSGEDGFSSAGFRVQGVDFNATDAYLSRGGALTGLADGREGTLSFWVRIDGGNGSQRDILQFTGDFVQFSINASNKFFFSLFNAAGTIEFQCVTNNAYVASVAWRHVFMSWSTDATAGNKLCDIYINDVSDKTVAADAGAAFDIDYTRADVAIGGTVAGGSLLNGCLAELWFNSARIDGSVTANRRKFITASLKPVNLGLTGHLPTGSSPIVYQRLLGQDTAVSSFNTNRGTGGGFTQNGTTALCSTNPGQS